MITAEMTQALADLKTAIDAAVSAAAGGGSNAVAAAQAEDVAAVQALTAEVQNPPPAA